MFPGPQGWECFVDRFIGKGSRTLPFHWLQFSVVAEKASLDKGRNCTCGHKGRCLWIVIRDYYAMLSKLVVVGSPPVTMIALALIN